MHNPDCCGGACVAMRCVLLEGCRVAGEICGLALASDCCSAICQTNPDGIGRCAPLGMCKANDGMDCTRQVGEVCGGNPDCCSRVCAASGDGVKRCAPPGGCTEQCGLCTGNGECCSGLCAADPDGIGRCRGVGTCGADGETCGMSADCCGGAACVTDATGAKRCGSAAAACRSQGASCAISSECCHGPCTSAENGFACSGVCAADGAGCTATADCCNATSECLRLRSRLVCAQPLR